MNEVFFLDTNQIFTSNRTIAWHHGHSYQRMITENRFLSSTKQSLVNGICLFLAKVIFIKVSKLWIADKPQFIVSNVGIVWGSLWSHLSWNVVGSNSNARYRFFAFGFAFYLLFVNCTISLFVSKMLIQDTIFK